MFEKANGEYTRTPQTNVPLVAEVRKLCDKFSKISIEFNSEDVTIINLKSRVDHCIKEDLLFDERF